MKILFYVLALLLVYTYVGYPLLIYILAKFKKHKFVKNEFIPSVSIVLVAYNEQNNIEKKIKECLDLDYPSEKIDLIIVSDGSDDGTDALVMKYADKGVSLLNNGERRGKSACLNDGVAFSGADYIIFCDARQEIDRLAAKSLMQYFADEDVGAVSGEMFFKNDGLDGYSDSVDFYWKYEKFIRKNESMYRSVVGVTGALYAIKKEYFKVLPQDVILDDVMVPMNIIAQNKKVLYSPEAMIYDYPSTDLASEERRKRRTLSGNYQLISLMPWLLSLKENEIWFEYISHKVLRLLSPFLLAMFFFVSLSLIKFGGLYVLGFIGISYLCVASLVGIYFKQYSSKSFIKIPLSFMTMNYFAFMGFCDFFSGKKLGQWK